MPIHSTLRHADVPVSYDISLGVASFSSDVVYGTVSEIKSHQPPAKSPLGQEMSQESNTGLGLGPGQASTSTVRQRSARSSSGKQPAHASNRHRRPIRFRKESAEDRKARRMYTTIESNAGTDSDGSSMSYQNSCSGLGVGCGGTDTFFDDMVASQQTVEKFNIPNNEDLIEAPADAFQGYFGFQGREYLYEDSTDVTSFPKQGDSIFGVGETTSKTTTTLPQISPIADDMNFTSGLMDPSFEFMHDLPMTTICPSLLCSPYDALEGKGDFYGNLIDDDYDDDDDEDEDVNGLWSPLSLSPDWLMPPQSHRQRIPSPLYDHRPTTSGSSELSSPTMDSYQIDAAVSLTGFNGQGRGKGKTANSMRSTWLSSQQSFSGNQDIYLGSHKDEDNVVIGNGTNATATTAATTATTHSNRPKRMPSSDSLSYSSGNSSSSSFSSSQGRPRHRRKKQKGNTNVEKGKGLTDSEYMMGSAMTSSSSSSSSSSQHNNMPMSATSFRGGGGGGPSKKRGGIKNGKKPTQRSPLRILSAETAASLAKDGFSYEVVATKGKRRLIRTLPIAPQTLVVDERTFHVCGFVDAGEKCAFTFESLDELKAHRGTHRYLCRECSETFTRIYDKVRHQSANEHSDSRDYNPAACHRRRKRSVKDEVPAENRCEVCEQGFSRHDAWKRHMEGSKKHDKAMEESIARIGVEATYAVLAGRPSAAKVAKSEKNGGNGGALTGSDSGKGKTAGTSAPASQKKTQIETSGKKQEGNMFYVDELGDIVFTSDEEE